MDIEELSKECRVYIENSIKLNPMFFYDFKNIHNFCKEINNNISDDSYDIMKGSYEYIESIENGNLSGPMTISEIIEICKSFLGEISLDLKEQFITSLNNGLISIDKDNSNHCLYFSKTIDGVKKIIVKFILSIQVVLLMCQFWFMNFFTL